MTGNFIIGAAARVRFAWKREWTAIIVVFVLMRIIISAVAATSLWNSTPPAPSFIPPSHPSMQVFTQTATGSSMVARVLLNGWYRWDTGYFVKIGLAGYSVQDGSLSFMPFYPLTIHLLEILTHANALLLALILSNLFCLVALILFYEVARCELGERGLAWDALLYFVTFPAAFFMFAGYSESLYMLLTMSLWLLLRRNINSWAAFACGLAILTRLQGVALILPMIWQVVAQQAQATHLSPMGEIRQVLHYIASPSGLLTLKPARLVPVMGAALVPAAALLFYNGGLKYSGLTTVIGAYSGRNSALVWPWVSLAEFIQRIFTIQFLPSDYVDLALVILFVTLTILGLPKIRPALSLYSICVLEIVFSRSYSPNLLSGFMRFALTTFPLFIVLAALKLKPPIKNLILLLSVLTQLFMTWLFINWIWVA